MWNTPSKQTLSKIPGIYKTQDIPLKDKMIYLHFSIDGTDFYIAEYDGDTLFWGFTILNNDLEMAEWGYISFTELKEIRVGPGIEIDCEINWTVKKACEIENIMAAQRWYANS